MPAAGGPNTLGESNLVFAYDTGDVKNSYPGIPAVNCAQVPSSGYNWTVTEITDGSITPPRKGARVFKFECTNASNLHRQGGYYSGGGFGGSNPTPLILGRTSPSNYTTVGTGKYRFGMWVRGAASNSTADWYIDIGDANGTGLSVNNNTEWQLISTTDASGIGNSSYPYDFFDITGTSGQIYYVADYGIFRSPGTVDSLPILQAYPQWVDYQGTRSATQGLLPLIGNSTINLTNVSFNSNAKMVFDGTNDYVNVPYNTSHNLTNQGTISAWINPATLTQGSYAGIVAQCTGGSANAQAYQLSWRQVSNGIYGAICNGSGTYNEVLAAFPSTANVWYNIVFTWNGAQLVLYINGVASSTTTQTINNQVLSTDLTIGGFTYKGAGGSGEAFNGKVDKVELYNRGLSSQEVKQNYQQYKTRFNLS